MKTVTVKSTKQDILEAYEELSKAITTPISPVKNEKSAPISAISKVIASLTTLLPELEKEQALQTAENLKATDKLNTFYRDLTRTEEELKYALKKDRTEKYDTLDSELKAKRIEFDVETSKKLSELQSKEAKLKELEDELKELRDTVKMYPARLVSEVNKAIAQTRTEEQAVAKHATDLIAKDHEGALNLANQKIAMLESTVSAQAKEIVSLKSAYDHAASEMKSMAVSLIEANRPLPAQPAPSKE